jgi:hypothetical protein
MRVPHWEQNKTPSSLFAPQAGQTTLICAPQPEQKIAPLGFSVSHFGQRIPVPNSAGDKQALAVPSILTENYRYCAVFSTGSPQDKKVMGL